jgi:hypothetical protein
MFFVAKDQSDAASSIPCRAKAIMQKLPGREGHIII